MVDGKGDPNTSVEYEAAVAALYAVSYTLKFSTKRSPSGVDYKVMPLEGLWWSHDLSDFTTGNKSDWEWTMMIMQPDFVTPEDFEQARDAATAKKDLPAAPKLRLEKFREGSAAQVMYVGPYSDEGPTIKALHEFIEESGYVLDGKHHEIYLGDPRRTAPEKLKTIIRQPCAGATD
ncbi:MAG: GyrI-like domain-containing protein [Actinobacteria bacterium]|nr:GyrI-like domain-containing protein [Actinomycetota bacterium]